MKKADKILFKQASINTVPFDNRTEAEKLIDATWHFAYASLWPQEKFKEKEIKAIKNIIAYYLQVDSFLRQSFTIFIEAIVLHKRRFPNAPALHPLVWLNQGFNGGIIKALECYNHVKEIRKEVPLYENAVSVLAKAIFKYTKKPTPSMVGQCRALLLLHKDQSLLNLFYFHIIHSNYIN